MFDVCIVIVDWLDVVWRCYSLHCCHKGLAASRMLQFSIEQNWYTRFRLDYLRSGNCHYQWNRAFKLFFIVLRSLVEERMVWRHRQKCDQSYT